MFKCIENLIPLNIGAALCLAFVLFNGTAMSNDIEYDIRQALPQDAIPAIKKPKFVSASKANINPSEPVIGITINGDSRAYSVYLLNSHEIVNDVVGGKPVAVTW